MTVGGVDVAKVSSAVETRTGAAAESLAAGGELSRAVLAFYRLSRTLRTVDPLHGLTWEWLSALSAVARREPVSITELSAAEGVTASTISRAIGALEAEALVRCAADSRDRRSVLVTCTRKGRAALAKGMARSSKQIAAFLGRFELAELEAIARLIRQIRDAKNP